MANTGRKIYANLTQIYVDTGLPTGEADKPNDPVDPDYVPPVIDLVTCPPDVTPPFQPNKILIQVVNNSSQVVVIEDVLIRAQAILDLAFAYWRTTSYSILPHTTDNSFVAVDQLDSVTKVVFTCKALGFDIPANVAINYKLYSEGSFSTMYSSAMGENDVFDQSISTPMESGSNTNVLQIVFT